MQNDMETFCKNLPKLELHAHLNGSLSMETLRKLHQTQNEFKSDATPWNQCEAIINHGDSRTLEERFSLFGVAHKLTSSPEAVRQAAEDVIWEFSQDGVIYLELRSTPREVPNVMMKFQYIEEIVHAIQNCSRDRGIIVKLLVSIDRCQGLTVAEETLGLILQANRLYPDIVVGIDLSGNPTKGDIREYFQVLEECRAKGLKLSLHCAEVANEAEVKAILDFKPDRIGHGTCINPSTGGSEELWKLLTVLDIPVEICLTSNVKCKTVHSYENHHFKFLYSIQHPLSLATDDKGVFSTTLTREFIIAAKTFNLSKECLWKICFESILFTFATGNEKEYLRKQLLEWKNFHPLD